MLALIVVSSWTFLSVSGNDCCECTDSSYSPNCNEGCDGTICPYDPYCCQGQWDWICANSAAEECQGPAPPSGSTACCECTEASNSANCNEECDGNICSYDPYCCNWSWDWICADAAKVECEAAGGSGEESSESEETPEGTDAACCDCTESEEGPNCSANPACNPIVCPLDSYCCDWSWDNICANGAQNICNSVDYWSWPEEEETGSCCDCTEEGYGAGCNEVCDNEVCPLDNYCCDGQWDSICADGASNICQGYNYYGSSDDWNSYSYEPYSWDNEPSIYGFDSNWEPYTFEDSYEPYGAPAPYWYESPAPWSYQSDSYGAPAPAWNEAPEPAWNGAPAPVWYDETQSPSSPWNDQSDEYDYYDSFGYNYESNYPYYYDYDEEENDDCFWSVCGDVINACASSPDCYSGFMAAEAECEGDQYESLEHCVEQLVQGPNEPIIQFCNGNETAAGDLQAVGQCFLNLDESGACNEEEMSKLKFKSFVNAMKKAKESKKSKKSQKSRLTKKKTASRKDRSKRAKARSDKIKRRPRLTRKQRPQRKVRSQRSQRRVRPNARRTLAQRQRRPRLSRRVRGRVARRQRPQRSRRYRARLGRAMAKRKRQRQRQRSMRVQGARGQRSRRD